MLWPFMRVRLVIAVMKYLPILSHTANGGYNVCRETRSGKQCSPYNLPKNYLQF